MDINNLIPSPPKGEPAMDTCDWRAQYSRENIVYKILETLKKHLPYSGPEGIEELRKIASRFEEKIFNGAVDPTDYHRKISMKMLIMETKSQSTAGSTSISPIPFPGAYNSIPLKPGCHQMTMEGRPVKVEPVVNTGDWRTFLPPDSRKKNVNKIKGTLKKHVPNCGQEGNKELKRITTSFEELIFNTAIDQVDYFRKISFKMQTTNEGD